MSRRKQLKPRCHNNNNEQSFMRSSNPRPIDVKEDICGFGTETAGEENEIGTNDDFDFDTSGPSYVPLSPVRRDCDSPESPTSDDMPLGEMDKPNSTGNYHWCAFCPATFDQIVTLKAHEQTHCNLMAYRCTHCERGFRHKRSLDRHLKLHVGTKNFQCDTCGSAFFRADHLKLHIRTHSVPKSNFVCSACTVDFTSIDSLEEHKQSCRGGENGHSMKTEYICSTCGQVVAGEIELKQHRTAHANERSDSAASPATWDSDSNLTTNSNRLGSPLIPNGNGQTACGNCPKVFRDVNELLQHMPFCSGSPSLTCPICGQNSFQTDESLFSHMDACHKDSEVLFRPSSNQSQKERNDSKQAISCGLCSKRFGDVDSLQKHTLQQHSMREIDPNADPRYPCEHCEKTFDSILALHGHVNLRHNGIITSSGNSATKQISNGKSDVYVCSLCHIALSDLKSFTKHMAMEHMEVKRPNSFVCEQCGLTFTNETMLDAHLVRHFLQKESQFGCKSCGKSFSSPDELQKHLIDLHAAHLFRCSLCKEIFESRVDIQVHFAVAHSNETVSYRCRTCNAIFESEQQFNVHLQAVHLRRPLSCLQKFVCCEKTFTNEKEFSDHCSTHKPFVCKLCGESFVVEYLLERHVESAHSYGSESGNNRSQRESFTNGYKTEPTGECDSLSASLNFPTPSGNPGLVKCNICDRKCESVRELADHKLQHCKVLHSETCSVCRMNVNSLELFYTHTRQHNAQGIPVACVICRQSLVSSVELQAHAKFHLRLSDLSSNCPVCNKTKDLSDGLICKDCEANGSRKTDGENGEVHPTKCSECRVKFETIAELKEHCRTTHLKPYECIKCQKSFATEEEIHSHIATHVIEDGVFHQCGLCVQYFDSPSKLQCHLIEHSFAGCQEFQCYLCNLVFSLAAPLMQHMLKAHSFDERPYDCANADCRQKFFFRAELDNHMLTVHLSPLGNGSQPQEKSESNREGKIKRINNSTASMSNFASFPCPNCAKVFSSLSALQGHSHVHMTCRVHKCSKCDKEFSTAAKLRNHQRQHSGERPHDCYICKRQFSRKDNLKAHMQIHYKMVNGVMERVEEGQQSALREDLEFPSGDNSVEFEESSGGGTERSFVVTSKMDNSVMICFDDTDGDSNEDKISDDRMDQSC